VKLGLASNPPGTLRDLHSLTRFTRKANIVGMGFTPTRFISLICFLGLQLVH
jgi:hypothetical protein